MGFKKAYIIPGFLQNSSFESYKEILKYFKDKEIDVEILDIDWKRKTMGDYVEETFPKLEQNKEIILLGFSFGAMISFILSTKLEIKYLILCSLSPFFSEDVPLIKKWWRKVTGQKRMGYFEGLSFNKLTKQIQKNPKIYLLYGEKESILCINRGKDAHKKLSDSKLIEVKNTKHDIGNENYLEEIKKIVHQI